MKKSGLSREWRIIILKPSFLWGKDKENMHDKELLFLSLCVSISLFRGKRSVGPKYY